MRFLNFGADWRMRWISFFAVATCVVFVAGCTCTGGDQTVAILDVDGERWFAGPCDGDQGEAPTCEWVFIEPSQVVFPDASIRMHVESGWTIQFFNATEHECTVLPNKDVYVEGGQFKIQPGKCRKRTLNQLDVNTEIDHVITCGDDDHGTPGMIVVQNNHEHEE